MSLTVGRLSDRSKGKQMATVISVGNNAKGEVGYVKCHLLREWVRQSHLFPLPVILLSSGSGTEQHYA